jgi:predicted metal-binding membrane protein
MHPPPLRAERHLIFALLVLLGALAWGFLWWQASVMDMTMAMSATMGMAAPLFVAVWVVMMIAMMFPAAAPMILVFHRVQAARGPGSSAFVATWIFVAGYMLVWTAAGAAAYLAAAAGERVAIDANLDPVALARIGGAILILAGFYQLSPLKRVCLSKCQTPLGFVVTSWREGSAGALRMGMSHGLHCLGCCWLLFVILFPLGMMNIAALATITLLIFAEKSLQAGQLVAQIVASMLIAYGATVLAIPWILPTFMNMPRPQV